MPFLGLGYMLELILNKRLALCCLTYNICVKGRADIFSSRHFWHDICLSKKKKKAVLFDYHCFYGLHLGKSKLKSVFPLWEWWSPKDCELSSHLFVLQRRDIRTLIWIYLVCMALCQRAGRLKMSYKGRIKLQSFKRRLTRFSDFFSGEEGLQEQLLRWWMTVSNNVEISNLLVFMWREK